MEIKAAKGCRSTGLRRLQANTDIRRYPESSLRKHLVTASQIRIGHAGHIVCCDSWEAFLFDTGHGAVAEMGGIPQDILKDSIHHPAGILIGLIDRGMAVEIFKEITAQDGITGLQLCRIGNEVLRMTAHFGD